MGVDVNEGASRIAQLLQPEQPSDSAPEEPQVEVSQEVEQDQPEVEAESVEPTTESESEDFEEETQDASYEDDGDTETEEPKHKVKVNGEEQEVTLEDLRKGYMMESDYRKKTSEVARQREEVVQKQTELKAKVEDAERLLLVDVEDLNSEENLELKEYDRSAYEEKVDKLRSRHKRLEELKQKVAEDQRQLAEEKVSKERELLLQQLPEWLDSDVLKSESEMLTTLWSDMGFTQEELNSLSDHRLVILSREAALYRKMKKAKPETKKVVPKPKSAKPGHAKTKEERKSISEQSDRSRLRKTGSMKDAKAVIKGLLTQ